MNQHERFYYNAEQAILKYLIYILNGNQYQNISMMKISIDDVKLVSIVGIAFSVWGCSFEPDYSLVYWMAPRH